MPALANSQYEAFCRAYAGGSEKADAARAAGYSESAAAKQASRLLARPEVLERIQELQASIAEKSGWSASKVLERLGEVVELKASDFDKPREEWTEAMLRWACDQEPISVRSSDGVQAGESKSWDQIGTRIKVTNRDKLKALELIGRHKAVDAFVADKLNAKLDIEVTLKQTTERLQAGRLRAAKEGK